MKHSKEQFYYIDEARQQAGFFVSEVCEFFGISERTWYRWQAQEYGPKWALLSLKLMCGDLEPLGWKGWSIEQGVLYNSGLRRNYYHWRPGNLLEEAFWRANGKHPTGRFTLHETSNVVILDKFRRGI